MCAKINLYHFFGSLCIDFFIHMIWYLVKRYCWQFQEKSSMVKSFSKTNLLWILEISGTKTGLKSPSLSWPTACSLRSSSPSPSSPSMCSSVWPWTTSASSSATQTSGSSAWGSSSSGRWSRWGGFNSKHVQLFLNYLIGSGGADLLDHDQGKRSSEPNNHEENDVWGKDLEGGGE